MSLRLHNRAKRRCTAQQLKRASNNRVRKMCERIDHTFKHRGFTLGKYFMPRQNTDNIALVQGDFASIEMRLLLVKAAQKTGEAADIFHGLPPGPEREAAKAVSFGLRYGAKDITFLKKVHTGRTQHKQEEFMLGYKVGNTGSNCIPKKA